MSNSSPSLLATENDESTKLTLEKPGGQSLCRRDIKLPSFGKLSAQSTTQKNKTDITTIADRSEVLSFIDEETGWCLMSGQR